MFTIVYIDHDVRLGYYSGTDEGMRRKDEQAYILYCNFQSFEIYLVQYVDIRE